jgi:hypothetical protein
MNISVNLTRRVKTPDGWRYYPVATSTNGRVKPDYVSIGGKEEKLPGGTYYIDWSEQGEKDGERKLIRKRIAVGGSATVAQNRIRQLKYRATRGKLSSQT